MNTDSGMLTAITSVLRHDNLYFPLTVPLRKSRITTANRILLLIHRDFSVRYKQPVQCKDSILFVIKRLSFGARVGNYAHNGIVDFLIFRKKSNGIFMALAHFSAVNTGNGRRALKYVRLRNSECSTKEAIEFFSSVTPMFQHVFQMIQRIPNYDIIKQKNVVDRVIDQFNIEKTHCTIPQTKK